MKPGVFARSTLALIAVAWAVLSPCFAPAFAARSALPRPSFSSAPYLNPNTGRFWTRDSFEGNQSDPLSLHKYLYAHADPVNRIDPSGNMDFIQLMTSIKTIAILAVNVGLRATPALTRVTVIVFEATTGNTVIIGGAGAVVALKAGGKMGGVGWATWQWVVSASGQNQP